MKRIAAAIAILLATPAIPQAAPATQTAAPVREYVHAGRLLADPATGKVLRSIETSRFVTGVTWVEGELWHGTWEEGESELRRIDPTTGEELDALAMPSGVGLSGLETNGADLFYCGDGGKSTLRAVRRPKRA